MPRKCANAFCAAPLDNVKTCLRVHELYFCDQDCIQEYSEQVVRFEQATDRHSPKHRAARWYDRG